MSKVVTIPKDRNPFVVIVNGVKYSYPAGVTTEVPDEVADVIEKYVGAKPKPDPNAGINFGGTQSDWSQTDSSAADFIKNKPFGDMPTGGDTLYWDGNTEGLENAGGPFWKISDATPTIEELSHGYSLTMRSTGGETTFTEADAPIQETGFVVIGDFCAIIPEDVNEDGFVIGKGTYFIGDSMAYISSFTIPGYTGFPVTKKIEEKYLPGAVILYADDEMYLYATEDTSDTSKRMTKAELLETTDGGRTVYLSVNEDGVTQRFALLQTIILPTHGIAVFNVVEAFTAEYVPEG